MRRVVVTGLGAITPVGATAAETWDSAVSGRSGIDFIDSYYYEHVENFSCYDRSRCGRVHSHRLPDSVGSIAAEKQREFAAILQQNRLCNTVFFVMILLHQPRN